MHYQTEIIQAGLTFTKSEGILPAPETAHAVKEAIDQALLAKENGEKKVIVFNFSGHGFFDLLAYKEYMAGNLVDYELPSANIQAALESSDMPVIDETQF